MTSAALRDRATFERAWPTDDEAFATLLASSEIDGAETAFAVTPFAVGLARGFLSLSRENSDNPLIRGLLEDASLDTDASWTRRLLVLLFDHAIAIPGLSNESSAQMRRIRDAHRADGRADLSPASWRVERKAAMALADSHEKSGSESLALEFVAALAWPFATAADSIGPSIWLLQYAEADAMACAAALPALDRVALEAHWRCCVDDAATAKAAAETETTETPSAMDLFRERHPELLKVHEDRNAFTIKAHKEVLLGLLSKACALSGR